MSRYENYAERTGFWGHPAHEPPEHLSSRAAKIFNALQAAFLDEAAHDSSPYVEFLYFPDGPQDQRIISLDGRFRLEVIAAQIDQALHD